MKVLAVMQNQWFRDPEAIKRILAKKPHWRRQLVARFLFAGCKSGRVLKQVFGDRINSIVWEEASPQIGGHSSACFPADVEHLQRALDEVQPDVVMAFGKIAEAGLRGMFRADRLLIGPHPAARDPNTLPKLRAMAETLASLSVTQSTGK